MSPPQSQTCQRCIYDHRTPGIYFDHNGVCNYCGQVEALKAAYGTGQERGIAILNQLLDAIRDSGRGKRYDCIVGVSGGTDSSYLLQFAVSQGLRPLAVHYDNTWNTAIASQNIFRVVDGTSVDLHTKVVDAEEVDDIYRAFFFAGVAEIEASTDLGYAYLLRQLAHQHNVKYILEGHSFVAEGITPLSRNYFDGRYIREIHRRFGSGKLESYPLMTLSRFLRSALLDGLRFIRPLWYLDYSKRDARQLLESEFGWRNYGGHHLENQMTAFYHTVYLPQKFSMDLRSNSLSAQARSGEVTRAEALEEYRQTPETDHDLIQYFQDRLRIPPDRYEQIMSDPPRHWTEFPTYKRHFEILRPLFYLLTKAGRVPESFYLKYCFPGDSQ